MESVVAERYRILDRIGEGGLGVVYRVEDLVEREIRALKVMPRASGHGNLRGEFLALARLRHENIVRVFDYGLTADGADFFTMELVKGRDLRAVAPSPSDPAFYRLLGGVLRALTFLHARGMVHADIKPSNVLIDEVLLVDDPARAARLADFGLAAHAADPASAAARGTFPYAAPEVYAGRLDARSDLYALGIMLYELAAGVSPFAGSDVATIVRRQRQGAPEDPRKHRPNLSPQLAELILALTEPEPGARLQTADEVLARINEIAGTDFTVAEERPQVDLTGSLVGRDRDLALLANRWDEAASGQGSVVLVGGEEGIGKTRLVGELKLRVQLAGGKFFATSAAPRADAAFGGVGDVLRQVAGSGDAQILSTESRFAFAEHLAEQLLALAATEPLALAIDDLGAADPGTIDLVAYLARAASAGKILIVAAGRTEGIDQLAASVANVPRLDRIDLPPLDRASVKQLVSGIFGDEIADEIAGDLHRASGGNPSFLERALASLTEAGKLGRKRGRWFLAEKHPAIAPPPDAVAAALQRLERVPPPVRAVVEAAAVAGDRFDFALLAAIYSVLDISQADVSEGLAAAIAARLLESELGGEALVFPLRAIRDAVYKTIEPARREKLHRAAIAALEARPKITAATLAEHYLAIGFREKEAAIKLGLAAAEERLVGFDHHGALRWYERTRVLLADRRGGGTIPPADRKTVAQIDEKLGDVRTTLGDVAEGIEDLKRALDAYAGDAAAQVRVTRKLADLLRQRGQGDEAIDRLMKALAQARTARLTVEEAACQYALARVRMYRAEYPAAAEHASAGLVLARAAGARELAGSLLRTRANIEIYRGDSKAAMLHIEAAVADNPGANELQLAEIHSMRGRVSVHAGDYARAAESLERAIATYARVGNVDSEARVLNNLGAACYFLGDWDRARSSWERFLALCERIDAVQEITSALNNLGSLLRDRGELTEALVYLDRGRVLAEKTSRAHLGAMLLANRGDVLFRQGDVGSARECYDKALGRFEALAAHEDIIETRRRLCELDLASGHIETALDRAIDAARDAQKHAAKLEEGILHRIAATALRIQGDLDSSTWFLERAREILTTLGARHERAKVDVEAAELATARGRPADAEAAIARALETFSALGARWDLVRARERARAMRGASASATTFAGHALQPNALQVLLDVARASGRMDLEKLLEVVLDKILEVTRFERGFILLLDARGRPTERMRRVRNKDAGEFDSAEADFSGSIVRRVASSGEPAAITDTADDPALREQKSIVALGLRSIMCVPMRLKGRVTGIVYVDSRLLADEQHMSDIALLEALASQAAILIENARLVAEERRKTELMAILAHEIRNPLAGILGFSELLPEETAEMPDRFVTLMGRIHNDAQRLKRLVDNILELARLEAGKVDWSMKPIPVADLLRDVQAAYEVLASKKKITLVAAVSPSLPRGLGNVDRLFQVLSNLVGNALKFTPSSGTITLSARTEMIEPPPELLGASHDDLGAWTPLARPEPRPFVRIDVMDTGPGIPVEKRNLLFEKFAQGEEKRQHGVGLGLFISREIIRQHGGTIWVESNPSPGGGSCFSFRIPSTTGS